MRRLLSQRKLARLLGISPAMVTKHKQNGMPVHSVEAAMEWRRQNLDPGLVKDLRQATYCAPVGCSIATPSPQWLDGPLPGGTLPPTGRTFTDDDGVRWDWLMQRTLLFVVDYIAYEATRDMATWREPLRRVMRQVPEPLRDRIALQFDVWEALIGKDVIAKLGGNHEALPPDDPALIPLTADSAEAGKAMYRLACGELMYSDDA